MLQALTGSIHIDIEQVAGAENVADSSQNITTEDVSNAPIRQLDPVRNLHPQPLGDVTMTNQQSQSLRDKEWILVCRVKQNYKRVYHADITQAPCDYTSFHTLNRYYYGWCIGVWKLLAWKQITSIEFVKVVIFLLS